MSSVFSRQDQFCPFWDQFYGFAYINRLANHYCLGITFAVVKANLLKFSQSRFHLNGNLSVDRCAFLTASSRLRSLLAGIIDLFSNLCLRPDHEALKFKG